MTSNGYVGTWKGIVLYTKLVEVVDVIGMIRSKEDIEYISGVQHALDAFWCIISDPDSYFNERIPDNNKKRDTGWCSKCDREVSIYWEAVNTRYEAFCPHCASKLMLG